jgi:hypothetical protein
MVCVCLLVAGNKTIGQIPVLYRPIVEEVKAGQYQVEDSPSDSTVAWRYEVSLESKSVPHLEGLLQSQGNETLRQTTGVMALADSFSFDLHATMSVILLSRTDDSLLTLVSFHDGSAEFKALSRHNSTQSQSLTDEMSFPLLITSDSYGRIGRVQVDTNTSILYQDHVRGLFSLLQFYVPSGTVQVDEERSQEEFATYGKYVARYRFAAKSGACGDVPQGNGVIFLRKIRERFKTPRRSPICGELTIATKVKTTGDILACVDTIRHRVISLDGEVGENVWIGTRLASQTTSTISVRSLTPAPVNADTASALRRHARDLVARSVSRRLFEEREPPKSNIMEDTARLMEVDEAALLRQIDTVQMQPDSARMAGVARAARALAAKDHSFCGRLAEKLSRMNTSARLLHMACGVLAELNVEEAHLALIALLKFYAGNFERYLVLMPAIGRIRNPSANVESTLWSLADSSEPRVRSAAEQALGVLAHCMSRQASERREAIARKLSDRLENAENEQRKCELISVLGNTATAEALLVASRHLTDPSDQVRRASASALRWVQDMRADTLLAVVLLNDSSNLVRQGAMDALDWREPEPVALQAELRVAVHDPYPAVRSKALKHLESIRQDFPEVEDVIVRVAKSDPSEEVRSLAREMLRRK